MTVDLGFRGVNALNIWIIQGAIVCWPEGLAVLLAVLATTSGARQLDCIVERILLMRLLMGC